MSLFIDCNDRVKQLIVYHVRKYFPFYMTLIVDQITSHSATYAQKGLRVVPVLLFSFVWYNANFQNTV